MNARICVTTYIYITKFRNHKAVNENMLLTKPNKQHILLAIYIKLDIVGLVNIESGGLLKRTHTMYCTTLFKKCITPCNTNILHLIYCNLSLLNHAFSNLLKAKQN